VQKVVGKVVCFYWLSLFCVGFCVGAAEGGEHQKNTKKDKVFENFFFRGRKFFCRQGVSIALPHARKNLLEKNLKKLLSQ